MAQYGIPLDSSPGCGVRDHPKLGCEICDTSPPGKFLPKCVPSCANNNAMKTCKPLNNLVHYRPFWVDQLQALAWEHRLPNGTFDLPHMSLSQLRAAVARPYRFERSLLDRRFSRSAPLQLAYKHLAVRAAQLVPGGRWLLAYGNKSQTRPSPLHPSFAFSTSRHQPPQTSNSSPSCQSRLGVA